MFVGGVGGGVFGGGGGGGGSLKRLHTLILKCPPLGSYSSLVKVPHQSCCDNTPITSWILCIGNGRSEVMSQLLYSCVICPLM